MSDPLEDLIETTDSLQEQLKAVNVWTDRDYLIFEQLAAREGLRICLAIYDCTTAIIREMRRDRHE